MKAKLITAFGETKTIKEWSEDPRCIISYDMLRGRLKRGEDPELSLTTACKQTIAGEDVKIGDKLHRYTIKDIYFKNQYGQNVTYVLAECECGNIREVKLTTLTAGTTKSCGCYKAEIKSVECAERNYKHGKSNINDRLYKIWCNMKARCYIESSNGFDSYGGKGIEVCDEWRYDFEIFEKWAIDNGYKENLTIHRINNNNNYCPENCGWLTIQQQQKFKTTNILIKAWGETKILMEWSRDERCTVDYRVVSYRINNGWNPETAISKPIIHTNDIENRLNRIWKAIKSRCYNKNNKRYKDWGKRGIKVCSDWLKYSKFKEWALANGYNDELTIDRIDNDGNYCPENCRWVTRLEQGANKRNSVKITAWNETKILSEWARDERAKMGPIVIRSRIKNGWSPERAISTARYGSDDKNIY